MKTFIYKLIGDYEDEVLDIINAHNEWYDYINIKDMLHTHMYVVVDSSGNMVGFFGNAYWVIGDNQIECILCYVYVKEEYRKIGIFKKMVKYTIEHNDNCSLIDIGAMEGNELAHTIYDKMFTYSHYDPLLRGDFYIIKDRRNRK